MHSAKIKIHVQARDQLGTPKVKVVLDGTKKHLKGPAAAAIVSAKNLAQGTHKLVITVTDKGGNVVTSKQTWVVDSTEHFGSAAMWPGARGKDVKRLQKRLAERRRLQRPQERRLRQRRRPPPSRSSRPSTAWSWTASWARTC